MRYVIDQLKEGIVPSISGLMLYGTPIKGVEMVRIAKLAFPLLPVDVPGLKTICRFAVGNVASLAYAAQELQDLQHDWTGRVCNGGDPRFPANGRTWFPIRLVTGNDWVVTEDSARGVLGHKDWYPVDKGHIGLVKPVDEHDASYRHARSF